MPIPGEDALPPAITERIVNATLVEEDRERFAHTNDVDFAMTLPQVARCRANAYREQGRPSHRNGSVVRAAGTYHNCDMPRVRPISDLRNKTQEISRICHETGEPVIITKNGVDDLVVLSAAAWEREQGRLELYRLLDEAERDARAGDRGTDVRVVRRRLGR